MRRALAILVALVLAAGCAGSNTVLPTTSARTVPQFYVICPQSTERRAASVVPNDGCGGGDPMAWDYFFQSDMTYFYASIYGPFQVGSRYLIGGPIVIRGRDLYCTFEAAHDAVGDAALLYGIIRSRGAVWAANGNAARIRDLLGGFSNDYTGGFTVGAAVDFIVGALSLMGPADLAVLLLGSGLTAYALYRIETCEANQ